MHILFNLFNSQADIFNCFPVAGKFITSCTLTNNTMINIFTPMKPGLSPSPSDFEKKKRLVGSGYGTLADPMLYKLRVIFVFTAPRDDV